ncbi:MAG: nucleoside triphosphate pyrophosphohydrolase [Thermoleophilia bacterium]|nr:nucleoside triphosphate pyrophosphohydrolase [Thermoleophilia bacterium]
MVQAQEGDRPGPGPVGESNRREAVVEELALLYDLTATLRKQCPWDREQTQEDIVAYTLEEAYELVDAVRSGEPADRTANVAGELGDLLFQVYFLAYVAEQEGWYDLGEVAAGIRRKLVRRHPHIFGGAQADTPDQVRRTWDQVKRQTEGREGIFHEVPLSLPATLYAQKLQQRAAAVGFDWRLPGDVLAKIREEADEIEVELRPASGGVEVQAPPGSPLAAEIGDLLFAAVNLARKVGADPEIELRGASRRFEQRVDRAAQLARAEGAAFEDLDLDGQEAFYQRAKAGTTGTPKDTWNSFHDDASPPGRDE